MERINQPWTLTLIVSIFDRHDFVKFLHESIGDKIGPVIDEEIEKRSESTDINSISRQESLVQAVTQSVVESNE